MSPVDQVPTLVTKRKQTGQVTDLKTGQPGHVCLDTPGLEVLFDCAALLRFRVVTCDLILSSASILTPPCGHTVYCTI